MIIFAYVQFFSQPACQAKVETTGGIYAEDCGAMLRDFFRQKRNQQKITEAYQDNKFIGQLKIRTPVQE